MRDRRERSTSSPVEYLIVAIICGLVGVFLLSKVVTGAARERDIVFVCKGHHDLRTSIDCAETVWFNGDWRGAEICHGGRCWSYADLFPEAK